MVYLLPFLSPSGYDLFSSLLLDEKMETWQWKLGHTPVVYDNSADIAP